jgi:hypothetical protein
MIGQTRIAAGDCRRTDTDTPLKGVQLSGVRPVGVSSTAAAAKEGPHCHCSCISI